MRKEAEGGQMRNLGSSSHYIAELVCFTVVCADRKVRYGRKAKRTFVVGNIMKVTYMRQNNGLLKMSTSGQGAVAHACNRSPLGR